MAENYTVNYTINVKDNGSTAIAAFQKATERLTAIESRFKEFTRAINATAKKAPTFHVNTGRALNQINNLIKKVQKLDAEIAKSRTITITTSGPGNAGRGKTKGAVTGGDDSGSRTSGVNRGRAGRTVVSRSANIPHSVRYRALGQTLIDTGGIGAIDMLKGMGIAYGITGFGSLMGQAIQDATEYNNIIQTTKNILGAHDKSSSFESRFKAMERVARNVGIETKFTAPQVADASRFLAMAGFNVQDINQAIRPIADISLVGDTDLGQTADVVTNIMTGYGISSNNIRHAADIMTQTFTMTNSTLMEIAESYKYAGSLLSNAGVSFEEATAAIGILGDAGIKGSQAGTSLRTILANIVKPTNGQKKVWDKYRIKRTDENGNVRELTDIFTDLANAGLSIEDFYRMFHKTAAMAAVALTAHVDKWNEVVKENFLSDGLTAELADAKKNTIQGLWYQLTSMFTEQGMRAFESMDGKIREFLKSTIEWLSTSQMEDTMKSLGSFVFDLIDTFKSFTTVLMNIYKYFGGLIKIWLQFQVMLKGVLIPLRIFRSLVNFGSYIKANLVWLSSLTLGFNRLGRSTAIASQQIGGFTARFGGMAKLSGIMKSLALTWSTMAAMGGHRAVGKTLALKGRNNISDETLARYNRIARNKINTTVSMYGGGVGSIAGGMLGAYLGSNFGEEGSVTNALGSIGGALAGGTLGNVIGTKVAPWLATTAVPFLLTNPIGWGTLVAAGLGYGVYAFIEYQNAVEEANEANNKYLASTAALNGINFSDHATMADKYLSLVYNKQLDVNRVIGEHINLIREQLGLMEEGTDKLTGKKFEETHKEQFENASEVFGFWSSDSARHDAVFAPVKLADSSIDYSMMPHLKDVLDGRGDVWKHLVFKGFDYGLENERSLSKVAAAQQMYALGRDASDGTPLQKTFQNFDKQFMAATSIEDFNAVMGQLNSYRNGLEIDSNSTNWTLKDLGGKTDDQWHQNYFYVKAQLDELAKRYNWENPATATGQMLQTFHEILQLHQTNQEISNELLEKFMLQNGNLIFDAERFGTFGSEQFMRNFGYYGGKWHAMTGENAFKWFNPNTGKEEEISLTAEQAQQHFLSFHQKIIDLTNELSPKIRQYFNSFLNDPIWSYGGTGNGANGKAKLNGVEYTWDPTRRLWVPESGHGPLKSMTNDEMQKELSQTVSNGNTPSGFNRGENGTGTGSNGTGGSTGANASDYKSHYNRGNAAPKQVIVRINQLMNVDKIDLSNPDNAAVIANLKQQLTQALVDVVHDFDESWNG